jgi:glycosyltransferase involved in cell wall biosynthesis
MRILVFSQYFWPETFGINDLVLKLIDAGHDISVLTGKPNYPDGDFFDGYSMLGVERERLGQAEIVRVPLISRGQDSRFRLALNYLSFIFSGIFLAPFALRGKRFDTVFVYALSPLLQALPAIFLAALKRAKLVIWVQDLWPASLAATGHVRSPLWLSLIGLLVRFIYRRADLVLIQSEGFRAPISLLLESSSKIHYLPNAIDFNSKTVISDSARLIELSKRISDCFSVVFAGNLGNAQSLHTVLAAAEILRDHSNIQFFIVGSGSRLKWLKAEVARSKLNSVIFPGRFSPVEMPKIFAASSVLLATLGPETVFTYTIPSKIQAYLASGRPIIISASGEAARVVADARAGLTCNPGVGSEIAAAILRMQNMPAQERARLGENGKRYSKKNYDLDEQTARLITLIEAIR